MADIDQGPVPDPIELQNSNPGFSPIPSGVDNDRQPQPVASGGVTVSLPPEQALGHNTHPGSRATLPCLLHLSYRGTGKHPAGCGRSLPPGNRVQKKWRSGQMTGAPIFSRLLPGNRKKKGVRRQERAQFTPAAILIGILPSLVRPRPVLVPLLCGVTPGHVLFASLVGRAPIHGPGPRFTGSARATSSPDIQARSSCGDRCREPGYPRPGAEYAQAAVQSCWTRSWQPQS